MVLTLVALSVLADIAPGPFRSEKRPAPPPLECTQSSDCELSTFQGCCPGCCAGAAPHAIRRGVKEGQVCATVDCGRPDCSAVRCAKPADVNDYVAVCRANRCVAEQKTAPPPAQCRTANDCKVITSGPPAGAACYSSPCGCCETTQAVPVDTVPLQKKSTEPKKANEKPNFGLSTGGQANRPTPQCSPCPAPSGGVAGCQAGQCVLVEPPIPRPRPPG